MIAVLLLVPHFFFFFSRLLMLLAQNVSVQLEFCWGQWKIVRKIWIKWSVNAIERWFFSLLSCESSRVQTIWSGQRQKRIYILLHNILPFHMRRSVEMVATQWLNHPHHKHLLIHPPNCCVIANLTSEPPQNTHFLTKNRPFFSASLLWSLSA